MARIQSHVSQTAEVPEAQGADRYDAVLRDEACQSGFGRDEVPRVGVPGVWAPWFVLDINGPQISVREPLSRVWRAS